MSTMEHHVAGTLVEIPAWTDTWMRGARFGRIERVFTRKGVEHARVRLHKLPGKLRTYKLSDLTVFAKSGDSVQ